MVFYSLRLGRFVWALAKQQTLLKTQTSLRSSVLRIMGEVTDKKALVFLAPGAEEIEFTVIVDVLRRAGVQVYVCGVKDKLAVKCSHDVKITPDIVITDAEQYGPFDAMILPGGLGGSNTIAASAEVGKLLKQQEQGGRIVAAICAAPIAVKNHQIYVGRSLTSYPAVQESMTENNQYTYKTDNVVVDGPLITSRGPGTALQFAFTLADKLVGKEIANKVAAAMLLKYD